MLFIDKLPLQHLISWTFVPDKTGIRFRPNIRRNNPGHIPVPVHHPCLRQTNTKSKRKGSLFINHLHSPDLLDAGAAKKCRNQFSEISDNVASIFSGPFPFWRYRRNGYKQRKQHASKSGYPEYSKRAQSRTCVLARSEMQVVSNDFAEPSTRDRNIGGYWRVVPSLNIHYSIRPPGGA
jgi:hypothetical protein